MSVASGAGGASTEQAEDLRQETLLRVQRGLPHLDDEARFGGWLATIARNVWTDELRRRRPQDPLPEEAARVPEALQAVPEETEDVEAFVASWLPLMIEVLDEPYRTALRRVELEGWSQQRLARELGLSPSGARTRVQRGRRQLRELVDRCCSVAWSGGEVLDWRPRTSGCDCQG